MQTSGFSADRLIVMRLSFCLILLAGLPAFSAESMPTRDASLYPADLLQISETPAFSKHVILVDKSERKLLVMERDGESIRVLAEAIADIGKNNGNKERENDHKTPEGIYFFQQRKAPPEIPFSLYGKMAFTTDYPNLFDRRLKKTGYGIWLHSIPDEVPLTRGSRGCVVVRNEDLLKIEPFIQLRQTPIIVYDKISYIHKDEHKRRRDELRQWIDGWRAAWESQDADRYLSFYDESFAAPGFANFKAWDRHKRRLAKTYARIKVTLSQPYLLLHKDQLIIKTLQKYESDQHTDYGIKTIHALRTPQGYRILHEEWKRADERGDDQVLLSELPTTGVLPTSSSARRSSQGQEETRGVSSALPASGSPD